MRLYQLFNEGNSDEQILLKLSSHFYSLIPHRLGTKKTDVQKALINSTELFEEKQNLLQLMKDIIKVQQKRGKQLDTNRGMLYPAPAIESNSWQLKSIENTTPSIATWSSWTSPPSSSPSSRTNWSSQSPRIRPTRHPTSLKCSTSSLWIARKKSSSSQDK